MIRLDLFEQLHFQQLISWITDVELLITIAGYEWTYPLTEKQLSEYRKMPASFSFTIVAADTNKPIGHAELRQTEIKKLKVDKLLIGDQSLRGKGIGQMVIDALLVEAFTRLGAEEVELNVFDWNSSAIRCYEKTGFNFNPQKTAKFKTGDKEWVAVNMFINKQHWLDKQALSKPAFKP